MHVGEVAAQAEGHEVGLLGLLPVALGDGLLGALAQTLHLVGHHRYALPATVLVGCMVFRVTQRLISGQGADTHPRFRKAVTLGYEAKHVAAAPPAAKTPLGAASAT